MEEIVEVNYNKRQTRVGFGLVKTKKKWIGFKWGRGGGVRTCTLYITQEKGDI